MKIKFSENNVMNIGPSTIVLLAVILGVAVYIGLNSLGVFDGSSDRNTEALGEVTKTAGDASQILASLPPSQVRPPEVTNDDPPVKIGVWTWQTIGGLNDAVGGPGLSGDHPNSCLAQAGIRNTQLIVQNDTSEQVKLLAAGQLQFVTTTGDQAAIDIASANKLLGAKPGESKVAVVMSGGYSWGEDCVMAPESILTNPQNARGLLIAAAVPYCDWNVGVDFGFDNRIPVNADETKYNPEALNFVNAVDHIEAAQKYIANAKVNLKNTVTGKTEAYDITALGSWTPGDVLAAKGRPTVQYKGRTEKLVKIASTRKYSFMMPHILFARKDWLEKHRSYVETLIRCWVRSNERIKADPNYLRTRVAPLNSILFNVEGMGPAEWTKYFAGVTENGVDLGGSRVNSLSEVRHLFGLDQGVTVGQSVFALTYSEHGNRLKQLMPDRLDYFWPVESVVDTSFIQSVTGEVSSPVYEPRISASPQNTLVKSSFSINFATGSATIIENQDLRDLLSLLVRAGDTKILIEGHTDNIGNDVTNLALSKARAQAAWEWLRSHDPSGTLNEGRLLGGASGIVGYGAYQPIADNSSREGQSRNRRVVITLKS